MLALTACSYCVGRHLADFCLFIHSSIHSFFDWLIHASNHPYIHSFIHPPIHSFFHLLIDWFMHPTTHTFIHSSTHHSFFINDWLIDSNSFIFIHPFKPTSFVGLDISWERKYFSLGEIGEMAQCRSCTLSGGYWKKTKDKEIYYKL
jgi:hypothetical protein